jgi:hypothetical protein
MSLAHVKVYLRGSEAYNAQNALHVESMQFTPINSEPNDPVARPRGGAYGFEGLGIFFIHQAYCGGVATIGEPAYWRVSVDALVSTAAKAIASADTKWIKELTGVDRKGHSPLSSYLRGPSHNVHVNPDKSANVAIRLEPAFLPPDNIEVYWAPEPQKKSERVTDKDTLRTVYVALMEGTSVNQAAHALSPVRLIEDVQEAVREMDDKVELKDILADTAMVRTFAALGEGDDSTAHQDPPSMVRLFASTKPVAFDADRSKDYPQIAGTDANNFVQIGCVFQIFMPGDDTPTPIAYRRVPVTRKPQYRNTQGWALLFAKSPLFRAEDPAQAPVIDRWLGEIGHNPEAARGRFVQEKNSVLAQLWWPELRVADARLNIQPLGIVRRDQNDRDKGKFRRYIQYVFKVTIKSEDDFKGPEGVFERHLGPASPRPELRALSGSEDAYDVFGDDPGQRINEMDALAWQALTQNGDIAPSPSGQTVFRRGFTIL